MSIPEAKFAARIDRYIEKKLSAKPIDLIDGGKGVLLRVGPFIVAVSEEKALKYSDSITDAVERLGATPAQQLTEGDA